MTRRKRFVLEKLRVTYSVYDKKGWISADINFPVHPKYIGKRVRLVAEVVE